MFKIVDDIDLNEPCEALKRLGFVSGEDGSCSDDLLYRYIEDDFDDKTRYTGGVDINDVKQYRTVYIEKATREVYAYNDYYDTKIKTKDHVQDLIQAGLAYEC